MDGPHERLVEEYAEFLREVRGFAPSTTASHRSTVIEFLTRTAEPTHLIGVLSVTHVERYLSIRAAEVTRQTLQHTVAHLRAFLRYGFERGLPVENYSAYSLRHAFAMRLLERGVGVKAIGDLLGHRSLESTCVYLRLDMKALRVVALPVPGHDACRR